MAKKQIQVGWALIPPSIIASKLSANEKLLFGRIMGLTGIKGYCFASNYWLGKQLCISKKTVANMITKLKQLNLIETEIVRDDQKKVVERRIFVGRLPIQGIPIPDLGNTPIPDLGNTPPLENPHEFDLKPMKKSSRDRVFSVEYSYNNEHSVKETPDKEELITGSDPLAEKLRTKTARKKKKGFNLSSTPPWEKKQSYSESNSYLAKDEGEPLTSMQIWEMAHKYVVLPSDVKDVMESVLLSVKNGDGARHRISDISITTEMWLKNSIRKGETYVYTDPMEIQIFILDEHPDHLEERRKIREDFERRGIL